MPKKAELIAIVEGLAISAKLLDVVQTPGAHRGSELFGGNVSFEQYM